MSLTEVPETPRVKRPLSSRLKAHARKAAIPAMLLSITIGGVGVSATAHAAEGPSCASLPAQTCPAQAPQRGAQPSNVSDQDWRGAVTAADFWNTHGVDTFHGMHELVTHENQHFTGGWPGGTGRSDAGWYHFYTGSFWNRQTHWIWYGGVFQDRGVQLQHLEQSFGVSAANANGGHNVYREYDMLAYTGGAAPGSGRRGTYRIVRNTHTGHVYATFDHYRTFHYLGRW
ncbi:hypothetical protein GCM10022403_043370 [Streptomyces coacervatus]|uniref:Uncharacterized protein n=1 Tax=Streptomyces coacervatus TaxID=647381 RepID=A0ABP7HVQ5_9ACTN|nr:ribonuclease domain-containing protein [Streptomyces coacervatus]MDF2267085.1 ribonuclease domain-containing protein [Streptomyces coacervatus]